MSKKNQESIARRLINIAREKHVDVNLLRLRYGLERLLYRLSCSKHKDSFILKGASMFLVWQGESLRVTKDVDFLAYGSSSVDRIKNVFYDLCLIEEEEDGIEFLIDSISVSDIKDDDEYDGVRVKIEGKLNGAIIPLQVDIGFGDVVIPKATSITFPSLLNFSEPELLAYTKETLIAEKFETMVKRDIANSRMKDFFDICLLAKSFNFDGKTLKQAITETFTRRKQTIPKTTPLALTDKFYLNKTKTAQWKGFTNKVKAKKKESLKATIETISSFIMPMLLEDDFSKKWCYESGCWE